MIAIQHTHPRYYVSTHPLDGPPDPILNITSAFFIECIISSPGMILGGGATPPVGDTGMGVGAGVVHDAQLAYEMIGAVSSQLRDVAGMTNSKQNTFSMIHLIDRLRASLS